VLGADHTVVKVRSKATVEREVDVGVARRGGDVQEWIEWDYLLHEVVDGRWNSSQESRRDRGSCGLVLTGVRENISLWGSSRGVSIEAGAWQSLKRA
jgi:hypothetical protein